MREEGDGETVSTFNVGIRYRRRGVRLRVALFGDRYCIISDGNGGINGDNDRGVMASKYQA